MRVVFAGSPDFAIPCLAALLDAATVRVVGVFAAADRRAGRGRKVRSCAVAEFAWARKLRVFQFESLHDPHAQSQLRDLDADLMVVVAYRLLLPPTVLAIPKYGCVNVHASLLPRWRGAAPIERAIESGDARTGVSLMKMEAGLDCGAILAQREIAIAADDTGGSLHQKLARLGGELLGAQLPKLCAGELSGVAQNEADATYADKLTKAEAALNWRESADLLARKVRAFNPRPGAYAQIHTQKLGKNLSENLKILRAHAEPFAQTAKPGEIVRADKHGVAIATADGALVLTEVQRPGRTPSPAGAWYNGAGLRVGEVCG